VTGLEPAGVPTLRVALPLAAILTRLAPHEAAGFTRAGKRKTLYSFRSTELVRVTGLEPAAS